MEISDFKLKFYRILLFSGSVLTLGLWWIYRICMPEANDDLWVRIVLSLFLFIPALLSYYSNWVKNFLKVFVYANIYLIVLWTTYLWIINLGNVNYLIAQMAWFVVLLNVIEEKIGQIIYGLLILLVSVVSIFVVGDIGMNKIIYIVTLVSAFGFNVFNQYLKFNVNNDLEEALNDLQKFRMAVDNASEHIVVTDRDGKVLYANKAVEEITGFSKREIMGKTPALWGKQMPKEVYEKMWKTIKIEKKQFFGNLTNKRKNGQLYIAEARISPVLNEKGDLEFFIGIERDITELQKTQKELEDKMEELEKMNKLMVGRELKIAELKAKLKIEGDL